MGERYFLERAQEKGDGYQKLAGAVTALVSKSKKSQNFFAFLSFGKTEKV
jgi:hypothetical protein